MRELLSDAWWGLRKALLIVGVLVLLLALWFGWNAVHYWDVPTACRVLGGSWSPWYGWQCG